MNVKWVMDTDQDGLDNGQVDSGGIFQLIGIGSGWEVYPLDRAGGPCGRFSTLEGAQRWAEELIRRVVVAYAPDEECTDQSIEDSIRKLQEAMGEPGADGRPGHTVVEGESPTDTPGGQQTSVERLGSPVEGDPHAPHVGPTDLGWGQVSTIDEVRDGYGVLVPEARVTRWELGLIARYWHDVYETILDAYAQDCFGSDGWRYEDYSSYRLGALRPLLAQADLDRLEEESRRREILRKVSREEEPAEEGPPTAADNHDSGVGVCNTYGITVHYLPVAGERDRWLVVTLDGGRVGVVSLPWTRADVRRDIEDHGGDILYDEEGVFPGGTKYVEETPFDDALNDM